MIISKVPITIYEAKTLSGDLEERKQLEDYFKEFSKISLAKAKECTEKLTKLNNPKLTEEKIIQIVNFLPKDADELSKLFSEINLSSDEASAIVDITKNY